MFASYSALPMLDSTENTWKPKSARKNVSEKKQNEFSKVIFLNSGIG